MQALTPKSCESFANKNRRKLTLPLTQGRASLTGTSAFILMNSYISVELLLNMPMLGWTVSKHYLFDLKRKPPLG
jgi:hypothetical protein